MNPQGGGCMYGQVAFVVPRVGFEAGVGLVHVSTCGEEEQCTGSPPHGCLLFAQITHAPASAVRLAGGAGPPLHKLGVEQ